MSVLAKQKPIAVVHGSDAAPIIYFDGILGWGANNGVLQFEVAANTLVPSDLDAGPMKTRIVVTGHLRFSAVAARQLADLLDDALGVGGPPDKKDNG